jgi:hypothetical protein
MERSADIPENLQRALLAAENGYVPIPILPGTKIPAVKWKPWQEEMPGEDLIRAWFADSRRNLAIITAGLVVFDVDDAAKAELVLRECGPTPHLLRTPRGGLHLGYRKRKGAVVINQVKIKGLPIDIRTDGGLELLPPSRTENGAYEWLGDGLKPRDELPLSKIGWTRERSRRKARTVVQPLPDPSLDADREGLVRRARAYLATIEGAISGQRGHHRTFRVACVLTHKFGLTFAEAWPLLLEWNETCEPPWSERELHHKLSDAIEKRR